MERLGKFEIRGVLGRGAMGTVYDGWDPQIERRVAIKTVSLRIADDDDEAAEGLARFKREAQAAGRLSHENIVGVFDFGETDEIAYIVMEFIEGRSLKSLIDQEKRLPPVEAAEIMQQVLRGLDYSHKRGVVHRDIKPANVMLTTEGRVKLADFGIARISSSSMTSVGVILGTPAYMPPEQFLGEVADERSDIYSAGATLFHLLTGQRPYEGNPTSIMQKVLNMEGPPDPSQRTPEVPPAWDRVIHGAMARRPEDRFTSAAAFAEAIRVALTAPAATAADRAEADATMVLGQAPRAQAAAVPPPPPAARTSPVAPPVATRSRPGALYAGLGATGILLAGAAALLLKPSGGRLPSPPVGAPPAPARTPAPPPPPAAKPAPVIAPALPSLDDVRASLNAQVSAVPCSVADVTETDGALRLRGIGGPSALPSLRALASGAGRPVETSLQGFSGPYCATLDMLRPVMRGGRLDLSVVGASSSFADNTVMTLRVANLPFAGWLQMDYVGSDGSVVHVYPSLPAPPLRYDPPRLAAAGSSFQTGSPRNTITAGPPFGTDMIVAIESSSKLFTALPPQGQMVADYTRQLAAALAKLAAQGGRAEAAVMLVETKPK